MIQEEFNKKNLQQKITLTKWFIIALTITLVLLSAILLPIGFFINQNIHLFGWIPIAGLIVIVDDLLIFRYIFLKHQLKEEESVYLGKRKNITLVLMLLVVLLLIYDFIITIMKSVEYYLFPDNYFYGYVCALVILAIVLFLNSTDFSKLQVDSIVGGSLLIIYAVLLSPHVLSKFSFQVYPYLPFNLVFRSLLSLGLTIALFTFQRMRRTKILPLILVYTWIFIPFQIINWFGFTMYYPFEVTQDLFHSNPYLIRLIEISSIVIAACLMLFIITVAIFAVKLISSDINKNFTAIIEEKQNK